MAVRRSCRLARRPAGPGRRRSRLCGAFQRRQVEPRQCIDGPPRAGADLAHPRPYAGAHLLLERAIAAARRPARLRLCGGAEAQNRGMDRADPGLHRRPRQSGAGLHPGRRPPSPQECRCAAARHARRGGGELSARAHQDRSARQGRACAGDRRPSARDRAPACGLSRHCGDLDPDRSRHPRAARGHCSGEGGTGPRRIATAPGRLIAPSARARAPLKRRRTTASPPMKVTPVDKARILSEALPYMQRYDSDIVLLEQAAINPVVVHGGGPQIQAMLARLGIQSEFAAGLRITDAATVEVVEMVLAGSINKQIVAHINAAGGCAVGLCGKDGNLVLARKASRRIVDPGSNIEKIADLGFVGEPEKVDVRVLQQVIGRDLIPVLAPVAASADGGTFNVNADTFAGAIAGALKPKRLLLLTDVPGVLDRSQELVKELSVDEARRLIADGTISGGMIPKVETAIDAIEQGVDGVVILDGQVPHAVLLELLTDLGAGTLIHR